MDEKYEEFDYQDADIITMYTDVRCCVEFILDHSGSMAGDKIRELNEGIEQFAMDLRNEDTTKMMIDVGVVAMGGNDATVVREIKSIAEWEKIELTAGGVTPMRSALELANEEIAKRTSLYTDLGRPYKKPWIVLLTDGVPTDETGIPYKIDGSDDDKIDVLYNLARQNNCQVYTFFIGDPDSEEGRRADVILKRLAVTTPNGTKLYFKLSDKKNSLKELFLFLSKSVNVGSRNVLDGKTTPDPVIDPEDLEGVDPSPFFTFG